MFTIYRINILVYFKYKQISCQQINLFVHLCFNTNILILNTFTSLTNNIKTLSIWQQTIQKRILYILF